MPSVLSDQCFILQRENEQLFGTRAMLLHAFVMAQENINVKLNQLDT